MTDPKEVKKALIVLRAPDGNDKEMSHRQAWDVLFYMHYHTDHPGDSIAKFLDENFNWKQEKSGHLNALINQCRTVQGRHVDKIHPMMFGWMCEAWKCFMDEKYPKEVTDDTQSQHTQDPQPGG